MQSRNLYLSVYVWDPILQLELNGNESALHQPCTGLILQNIAITCQPMLPYTRCINHINYIIFIIACDEGPSLIFCAIVKSSLPVHAWAVRDEGARLMFYVAVNSWLAIRVQAL